MKGLSTSPKSPGLTSRVMGPCELPRVRCTKARFAVRVSVVMKDSLGAKRLGIGL